jgi:hypothetical protein
VKRRSGSRKVGIFRPSAQRDIRFNGDFFDRYLFHVPLQRETQDERTSMLRVLPASRWPHLNRDGTLPRALLDWILDG